LIGFCIARIFGCKKNKILSIADVSPTIIQELKTGKRSNITLETFNKVLNAIGYKVSFEPLRKNL